MRQGLLLSSISALGLALPGCWSTAQVECAASGRCLQAPPVEQIEPFVLGQPDEHTRLALTLGLNRPTHAVHFGSRLFIADSGNHRVIIRNNILNTGPTNPSADDIVLGQPDLSTNIANYGGRSASSLNGPHSLAVDGTRLVVADSGNRRVLIWVTIPTRNRQPADYVIGQPDFVSSTRRSSANGLGDDPDVALGSGLYVIDRGNHRVLGWRSLPTENYRAADLVVGQVDKTANMPNRGLSTVDAGGLNLPMGAFTVAGGRLVVGDTNNHRVLSWAPVPTADGGNAQLVLGQADFTSNLITRGMATPNAATLEFPNSVAMTAGLDTLAVTDGANRVLLWRPLPTASGQSANYVLGQTNFTSRTANSGGVGARSMSAPQGLSFDGEDLYIADTANNRVLHHQGPIAMTGRPATRVFGQPNFSSDRANNAGPVSASLFGSPLSVSGSADRLVVTDIANYRVLLWNTLPRSAADLPSMALGQPDLGSSLPWHGGTVSANGFSDIGGSWTDGTRLVLASGNRVLIWNTWPTSSLQPADLVLGQPNMVSDVPNNGGVSATSLWMPRVVHSDGIRLFIADRDNHRVLIWNRFPTVNRQPADVVLGQPNMTSNSGNIGSMYCTPGSPSATAQTLSCPHGLATDGNRLYVADAGNRRVLIWNQVPTTNSPPADLVIGQNDFTSTRGATVPSDRNFGEPNRMIIARDRLYVADAGLHRVLFWSSLPTQNGQPADGVIGQPDMMSAAQNNGGLSLQSLNNPRGLFASATHLFICDQDNQRVLALPL